MPQLTPFSWCAWLIVIAMQPALTVRMMWTGAWRRWPSVFGFLCVRSVRSLTLFGITTLLPVSDHRAALYFYTFWLSGFLCDLLEVWMIVGIGCAMMGVSMRVKRWIALCTWTCALIDLVVAVWLSHSTRLPAWGYISHTVFDLDRSISLAWLGTFLTAIVVWEVLGVRGINEVHWISIGYAVFALDATMALWLVGIADIKIISDVHESFYILALSLWTVAFCKAFPALPHIPRERIREISANLQTCVDLTETRRHSQEQ